MQILKVVIVITKTRIRLLEITKVALHAIYPTQKRLIPSRKCRIDRTLLLKRSAQRVVPAKLSPDTELGATV